jgi:hypothetical protein
MLRLGGALVGVIAVSALGAGGFANASPGKAKKDDDTAVVKIEQDGHNLFFDYPETVAPGADIKIKNTTDPQKVGPHSFTLVKRSDLPKTPDEQKACGHKLKKICGEIIKWHKVDVQTLEIGRNPVEVAGKGWDLQGSFKHAGDSWISEKKNQSFKQKVTAPEGKTLHFMCVVHPEMQGKIRVEG